MTYQDDNDNDDKRQDVQDKMMNTIYYHEDKIIKTRW